VSSFDSNEPTLLENVLADYYQAVEEGQAPLRDTLATHHPHLADALAEFFANEDRIDQLAAPLRTASTHPTIPGYEILGELGRGGMGVVYKARHLVLNRIVAVKMLRPDSTQDARDLARLRAEAGTIARLQHPNIVQLFEVGTVQDRPYLAMEFIDGVSLAAQLDGNPQPPRAAAELLATLADAMQHAHERGIIHRDLKPSNILLGVRDEVRRGRGDEGHEAHTGIAFSAPPLCPSAPPPLLPKIADFGLAKRAADQSLTVEGQILGTPSYMAPEQAAGKNSEVGPAADIYALGAILYECLTGTPPFRGVTKIETVYQVCHQETIAPRRLQPTVPRDLEIICLKCLHKEAKRRYATARDLADDLRRFLAGEPIRARAITWVERSGKWARRKPWAAAFALLLGMTCLAGLATPPAVLLQIREERDEARREAANQMRQLQETRYRLDCETRETALREHLLQGRKCLDDGDFRTAEQHGTEALAIINRDERLESLRGEAETVRNRGRDRLNEQAARQKALETWRHFQKLRDEARFHISQFTSLDSADNVKSVREAARAALALFGVKHDNSGSPSISPFLDAQRSRIEADCLELLLLWAEAEIQPLSRRPGSLRTEQAEEALRVLQRAETLVPSLPHVYHSRRAHFLTLAGKTEEASRARQLADTVKPGLAVDQFVSALEALSGQDLLAAVAALEETLRLQPDHFGAHYHLAVCYLRLTPPTADQGVAYRIAAKASLTAALNQKPEAVFLYIVRGFVHAELKEFRAAEADFGSAAQLLGKLGETSHPTLHYALLHNRGNAHLRKGDHDAALADLTKALEGHPVPWKAHVSLAQVYESRKAWDKAVEHLGEAIRLNPHETYLYRQRARVHEQRGDTKGALADPDKAIPRMKPFLTSPSLADDYLQRGSLRFRAGDFTAALTDFKAAEAIRPSHTETLRLEAEALAKLGRHKEAVGLLQRYVEQGGKPTAEVYRARGRLRVLTRDIPGAVDDLTRALDLQPDRATRLQRGWLLLLSDAPRLALRDFDIVLSEKQASGDAYAGRGNARAALGRIDDALSDASEATTRSGKEATVLCQAARIHALAAEYLTRGAVVARQNRDRADLCEAQALTLLRQSIELVPAEQRTAFWRDLVQNDAGFQSLWHVRGFVQLSKEYRQLGD